MNDERVVDTTNAGSWQLQIIGIPVRISLNDVLRLQVVQVKDEESLHDTHTKCTSLGVR